MLDILLNIGSKLYAACPVADGCNSFSYKIEIRIPVGGMPKKTFEVLYPRVIRQLPGVEAADGSQHKVKLLAGRLSRAEIMHLHVPYGFLLVPAQLFDPLGKLQILVHIVLPRQSLPVFPDLAALRELLRPVNVWSEAGLVDVRRNVTSDPWVDVFKPCAAL